MKCILKKNMSMENLKRIINLILENRGDSEITDIKENSHLRNDIGFDSMDLAELTVRIEAEYDVDIFEDGIVTTVGEIEEKIKKNTSSVL